jgi:hypothetical protein
MKVMWYYQIMGDVVGPLTDYELLSHIREGKVVQGTFLRASNKDEWVYAESVKGLFEAAWDSDPKHEKSITSVKNKNSLSKDKEILGNELPKSGFGDIGKQTNTVLLSSLGVGCGITSIILFTIILVITYSNRPVQNAPASVFVPLGVKSASLSHLNSDNLSFKESNKKDLDLQKERYIRANIERIRFEITQLQNKDLDIQREIDELESERRRADDELRRMPNVLNNQSSYFAIMRRSQDLSLAGISKSIEQSKLRQEIGRKKDKLVEEENSLLKLFGS